MERKDELFVDLKMGGRRSDGVLVISRNDYDIPIHRLLDEGFTTIHLVAKVTNNGPHRITVSACESILEDGSECQATRIGQEAESVVLHGGQVAAWFVPLKEVMDLIAHNFRVGVSDTPEQLVHMRVRLADGASVGSRQVLLAPTIH